MSTSSNNKQIVLEAFDTLFNKRDYEAAARYWSANYIQHSAHIPPGRDGLFNLIRSLPDTLRYENAVVVAERDFVLLHGRFTGSGRPRAWVAADIVRMRDGILVEHWDVLQDEATQEESLSGLPMFGAWFAVPDQSQVAAKTSLSVDEARSIVSPLYDALNQPASKDVAALLAKSCHPNFRSYSTNEEWRSREQLAEAFTRLGSVVPDLRWTIQEIVTVGNQIVVRGEAAGTPTGELFGAKPTGRSFKTLSIDLFSVEGGKLVRSYHVENWARALQQIAS